MRWRRNGRSSRSRTISRSPRPIPLSKPLTRPQVPCSNPAGGRVPHQGNAYHGRVGRRQNRECHRSRAARRAGRSSRMPVPARFGHRQIVGGVRRRGERDGVGRHHHSCRTSGSTTTPCCTATTCPARTTMRNRWKSWRKWPGVSRSETGIYAESEGTWIATVLTQQHPDLAFAILTSPRSFRAVSR